MRTIHAERRELAALLAELLVETHDWAWSLCGEREGLDDLRDRCKKALHHYSRSPESGIEEPTREFLKMLQNEAQPWREAEAKAVGPGDEG